MFRFLLSTLYTIVFLPLYVGWAAQQAEQQIDKMQEAAFNTPGAEAPIPPPVILGGAVVFAGHMLVGHFLLKLKGWQTWLALLFGFSVCALPVVSRFRRADK